MKRILTVFALLLAACVTVFAQGGYQVKGVVVDAMGPVIGATVIEQGTANGTSTGLDGDYLLKVSSADSMIEISCIGYASQVFKASEVPATITLAEDTHFLDEVVVIGYGTVKKSDLTGSVSTVKADEINKGVITTPADLLRGKTAGVVVTSGSGMPGSGATVRIRGGASLSADSNPLYIIDGLPVSNDGISGMSDPLSSINPEDIESFTVLKDASATAIYGSRASNGVIVITTKKGSKTASAIPNVAVDFTTSVATVAKYNQLLDKDGILALIREFYGPDSVAEQHLGITDATGKQTLYNTNWQKEIYQPALTLDGNISVNGKIGSFLPYRVSGGFMSQGGTLKGSKMNRGTLSLNLAPTFLNKHLSINLNGKGTIAQNWYANQGAISAANHYDPTKPVKNNEALQSLNGYTAWYGADGKLNSMATMNPVGLLNSGIDQATAYRFLGNAQIDYKVHGLEDLRFNLNLGMDYASSKGVNEVFKETESSYHNTNQSGSGSHTDYSYSRMDTTLEFYADYNHTFGKDHNLDVMAGYSWQHFFSQNKSDSYKLTDKSSLGNSVGKGELFLISFFGRVNYSFGNRYMLTATLRADGTSRFQNHKWGIFPSAAFGWNILNESFAEPLKDVMSNWKLRLSWGQTGQQAVGGYYDTFAQFLTTQLGSYYFVSREKDPETGEDIVKYTNPLAALGYSGDLRWETTTTYNIGMDLGFWNDRLTAGIDLYKRDTKDILNYIPVPALANLTNYLNTNIGSMTNMGVELELNGIILESRDLSWTAGFNVAYNNNKITKLTASDKDATGVADGGISGGTGNNVQMYQVGYPIKTYYLYQQVYDPQGRPISGVYVDRNNDGVINADDKYLGHHADADVTFGFNTNFTWKNWNAALSGHASVGNWVYNNVASDTEMLADLWTNNFIGNRVSSATASMFSQAQYLSDYYVQDGSFLKLDNFTLGYTFPKLFKLTADRNASLNIFGTVQNICTITSYKGIDPEVFGGIDGTVYPRPRTFILGIKFNF